MLWNRISRVPNGSAAGRRGPGRKLGARRASVPVRGDLAGRAPLRLFPLRPSPPRRRPSSRDSSRAQHEECGGRRDLAPLPVRPRLGRPGPQRPSPEAERRRPPARRSSQENPSMPRRAERFQDSLRFRLPWERIARRDADRRLRGRAGRARPASWARAGKRGAHPVVRHEPDPPLGVALDHGDAPPVCGDHQPF